MAQLASLAPTPEDFDQPPLLENAEGRTRAASASRSNMPA